MIEQGSTYVVMGVLDSDSIAYYVGKMIQELGGNVIYTAQNDRMKKLFFDRSKKLTDEEKAAIEFKFCDVTVEEEVKALFDDCGDIAGVVHSIAYANPKTSLGEEFHTDAVEDPDSGSDDATDPSWLRVQETPCGGDGTILVTVTLLLAPVGLPGGKRRRASYLFQKQLKTILYGGSTSSGAVHRAIQVRP